VNVPKADPSVTIGYEMRSLFKAPRDGYVVVGYDAAGLENRVEAHYCYPYEGGKEYADEILNGDPHTKNAFLFYLEDIMESLGWTHAEQADKDDARFKKFRNKSKSSRYALTYGCSPSKLASTLGKPAYLAEELYNAFWDGNVPLKTCKERLIQHWKTDGGSRRIKTIDGRWCQTRSEHSLLNVLFQSTGALVMDYAALFMDKWLGGLVLDDDGVPCYKYKGKYLYRVIYMHDEYMWEVPLELAEEIGRLGVLSIQKAGEFFKMNVPLTGEAKAGLNWAEVH
jgi:DNA polymerase-1